VARRNAGRQPAPTGTSGSNRSISRNVPRPDSRYQSYNEGNLFRVSVPANWEELGNNNSVTFAPQGGYGNLNGQSVFTHGMEMGLTRSESHDLQTATDELIQAMQQGNPRLSRPNNYDRGTIGGRQGLRAVLSNVSDATGNQEVVEIYTTLLGDGSMFYAFGVAPRDEYNGYANVFRNVIKSIKFAR
jgi:hypothetical protein